MHGQKLHNTLFICRKTVHRLNQFATLQFGPILQQQSCDFSAVLYVATQFHKSFFNGSCKRKPAILWYACHLSVAIRKGKQQGEHWHIWSSKVNHVMKHHFKGWVFDLFSKLTDGHPPIFHTSNRYPFRCQEVHKPPGVSPISKMVAWYPFIQA